MQTENQDTKTAASVSTGKITLSPKLADMVSIIPAPWDDSAQRLDLPAEPYPVPSGVTFPDGTEIEAFRVCAALVITRDYPKAVTPRIYGIRLGSWLVIFANSGEDASAAATLLVAQVDRGIVLADKKKPTAFYCGDESEKRPQLALTEEEYQAARAAQVEAASDRKGGTPA